MTDDVLKDLRQQMEETILAMRKELSRMRTGRASIALLEGIYVQYYGAKTPLNQVATVSVPEARLIVLQPYDRSVIGDIEKAIFQSDLGLTPQNDGKVVRIPIPEMTQDRRKDLVKHSRKVAEEYRVSLRNHRRDSLSLLKELEKEKQISEDDHRKAQEKIQEVTKEYGDRLEKVLKQKEEEIMEV